MSPKSQNQDAHILTRTARRDITEVPFDQRKRRQYYHCGISIDSSKNALKWKTGTTTITTKIAILDAASK